MKENPTLLINSRKIFYNNFLFIVGFLTLSLSVIRFFDYSITVAFFIIFFISYKYINKLNIYFINTYFFLITYLLFMAIMFYNNLDFLEFIKSFLLTCIMLFVFLSSLFKPLYNLKTINFILIIKFTSILLIVLELLQVFEKIYFGTTNLWFLFDGISISTATSSDRFQAANFISFIRPISFYHEPSYLGIILLVLLICSKQLQMHKKYFYLITFGIVLSFSTTALLFLILYFIILNLKKFTNFILFSLIIIIFLFSFFDWDTINSFIRINEILNSGTSGNARLIEPYEYLYDQIFIKEHYFGIPLGQSDLVFNNSFYLIFLYFGILAPFILVFFIIFILNKLHYAGIYYLIAFFALLFLSGSIFTLEDTFILYFLNLTFYYTKINKKEVVNTFKNFITNNV